jgi:hypothetical protein
MAKLIPFPISDDYEDSEKQPRSWHDSFLRMIQAIIIKIGWRRNPRDSNRGRILLRIIIKTNLQMLVQGERVAETRRI